MKYSDKGLSLRVILIFMSLLSLSIVGCSTKFYVNVSSFLDKSQSHGFKYVIVSMIENTDEGDLQFREASSYLETALAQKNYVRVAKIEDADLAVCLFYGIGDPQKHYYSYSSPVWGQIGGGSSTFTAFTMGPYGGTSTTTGTISQQPRYGVVGYQSGVGSYTTFTRFMSVSAIDLQHYQATEQMKELWKTVAVSTGSSGDLRRVIPILIAAANPYFASDTGKFVEIRLRETSKVVQIIKSTK